MKHPVIIRIILFIALTAAALMYCLSILTSMSVPAEITPYGYDNTSRLGEVSEIRQTFYADRPFRKIRFDVDTGSDRKGWFYFSLIKGDGSEIYKDLYDEEEWNGVIEFDKTQFPSDDNEYTLVFSRVEEQTLCLPLRMTDSDEYPEGSLITDGERCEGDISFRADMLVSRGMMFRKIIIVGAIYLFIVLHIFISAKKIWGFIYRYRVIVVLGIFALLVISKINFSSNAMFSYNIQPGQGSQYGYPLFGEPKSIRSDEWMVDLSKILSGSYNGYGSVNELARGGITSNAATSGIQRSVSVLTQPNKWGYILLGTEYGLSWFWAFALVIGFFFAFELSMILTGKRKLLSLFGAVLIWFSTFNIWWSLSVWLLYGIASLVMFNYLIESDKKLIKIISGILFVIFFSGFIVFLYPAWQVPAGMSFLVIVLLIVIQNRERIRSVPKKNIILIMMILAASSLALAGKFFYDERDYLEAITKTVYPGSRSYNGGYELTRTFNILGSFLMPFKDIADNPSEFGSFFLAFPFGMVSAVLVLIKKKGKDLFLWVMLGLSTFFLLYCTMPLPVWLCKMTLLSYSHPGRLVVILQLCNIFLLLYSLEHMESKETYIPRILAVVISAACSAMIVIGSLDIVTEPTDKIWIGIFAFIMISAFAVLIMKCPAKIKYTAVIATIMLHVITGMAVHPVMIGHDSITKKPVSYLVAQIRQEDPEAKWISLGSLSSGDFLIANGVSCYNSVNFIPNMDMYKTLDPEGEYEEVYNRYAHITVGLRGEDGKKFELQTYDWIWMYLSPEDFDKLNVEYIMCGTPLDTTVYDKWEMMYRESGTFIYRRV